MTKILIDSEKKIHLYNRDFDEMRNLLDITLQQTMMRMLGKGMDTGSITLKIDIALNRDVINDHNAPTGSRPAIHPEIDYKITHMIQQKDSVDGEIIPRGSDELLVDDNGNMFLVSKEEASGQLSMFDTWDEYSEAILNQREEAE